MTGNQSNKTHTPLRILFIPAWYPHRRNDMDGLFVRKHAQAASLYNIIDVLFVRAEPGLKQVEYIDQQTDNVHEHYIYYPSAKNPVSKLIRYFLYYHKGFMKLLRSGMKPDVVHSHILTRTGVLALIIYLRYHIPYVITEHWSRYFNYPFRNRWHQKLTQIVVRQAKLIMPVSESLEEAMLHWKLEGNYQVVRNVVDHFFFQLPLAKTQNPPTGSEPMIKTMIHICCFDETAKNNFGLLRVLKQLKQTRQDWKIIFVGEGQDWIRTMEYAHELGLEETLVEFTGKVQPQEAGVMIAKSDFMVLFSNYETASVVLCESLSSGKPVVATQTGGIPEIIHETNGILVKPGDEKAMKDAISTMLDHYLEYNPEQIREEARQFSFEVVGKKLDDIYHNSIN